MKKVFAWALILILVAYGWYRFSLRAYDSGSTERIPLTIEQGMSTSAIAELLEESEVIRSSTAFRLYARIHGLQGSLQAGEFIFTKDQSVPEVIDALQSGKTQEISITIPEGFTVKDIDDLLAEQGLTKPSDVIDCANTCDFASFEFLPSSTGRAERGGKLEGYLYPDTYFVSPKDFVVKFFLERLLTTFRNSVIEEFAEDIEQSPYDLDQIVIMASLVEEETRTDDERAIVAGILWKRFDAGTGLGVDATVRYALDKPSSALTVSDLDTNSDYNTRKFRGLPPGAIASPSLESIKAALHPEASEYWYYLHGTDGQIRYAKTNEEHNENKYKYLR